MRMSPSEMKIKICIELDKAKDLLLIQKFGRQLFHVYCSWFCGQIFEWAANLWPYLEKPREKSNWCRNRVWNLIKPMKLSPELAEILGRNEASRPECIKGLWAYITAHNLQTYRNRNFIIPDEKMSKIFGKKKIRGFGMSKFLGPHLSEL